MHIGATIRNMGHQANAETMRGCAVAAEAAGLESVWIVDHIAIPPDDAEGSGGRYVDPLVTLGWLAGCTESIKLGIGVLVLPYRPAFPTAKQIAAIQELSGERMLLGAGVGWMDAEFRALGVDRSQRGRITDHTLDTIRRCFAGSTVTENGQEVIFEPRPAAPPIYVGGRGPHAWRRALEYGDGWMPMAADPERLAGHLGGYREFCAERDREPGFVCAMAGLPLEDRGAAVERLHAFEAAGVDRLVCSIRYEDLAQYTAAIDVLSSLT